jgi:hypothetical protein
MGKEKNHINLVVIGHVGEYGRAGPRAPGASRTCLPA